MPDLFLSLNQTIRVVDPAGRCAGTVPQAGCCPGETGGFRADVGTMVKKTESEAPQEILEQGDIYFLYRPKVRAEDEAEREQEEAAAEDLGDVQNFYVVLKPQGGRFRLINIGRKPDQDGLLEGYKHKADPKDPVDVLHGRNSLGNVGYDGPLGTLNRPIRYRFRLFALDQPLELPPGLDKDAFLAAASGHVLEQSDLIVTYERGP